MLYIALLKKIDSNNINNFICIVNLWILRRKNDLL